MTQPPIRRRNHYVPEMYLKQWSACGLKVNTYRLLVPAAGYPIWKAESISGIAVRRHLYTQLDEGIETDALERWFSTEFEEPAVPVFERVRKDQRLSSGDWKVLVRFLAAQDVRTPARMTEILQRAESWLPNTLQNTLENVVAKLKLAHDTGNQIIPPAAPDKVLFPISVQSVIEPGAEMGTLGVKTIIGRGYWLFAIQHLLTHTIDELLKHRWTILRPPKGLRWLTSDNPVMKLNYYKDGNYDLKGGWGREGGEILLPLSPGHLLYAHIGAKPPRRGEEIQPSFGAVFNRLVIENAHRFVFAEAPDPSVPLVRARVVDADSVRREDSEWEAFHDHQVNAERELRDR